MSVTNEDILKLTMTGDPFRMTVVGFSAIEEALEELISESMPRKHRLELKRLSASFKVDLAIGLGVFDLEFKGVLLKIGKIRNRYAHEVDIDKLPFERKELLSAMEKKQRDSISSNEDPIAVLAFAIFTTYIDVTSRTKWVNIQRQERVKKLEEIKAVLAETPSFPEIRESEYYKDLDARIEARKQKFLNEITDET